MFFNHANMPSCKFTCITLYPTKALTISLNTVTEERETENGFSLNFCDYKSVLLRCHYDLCDTTQ